MSQRIGSSGTSTMSLDELRQHQAAVAASTGGSGGFTGQGQALPLTSFPIPTAAYNTYPHRKSDVPSAPASNTVYPPAYAHVPLNGSGSLGHGSHAQSTAAIGGGTGQVALPALPEMDRLSGVLSNGVLDFLAGMPSAHQDPGKHAIWEELIRLKTKSLELEIAQARQKEREAELELARLRQNSTARRASSAPTPVPIVPSQTPLSQAQAQAQTTAKTPRLGDLPPAATFDDSLFAGLPYLKHAIPPVEDTGAANAAAAAAAGQQLGVPAQGQTSSAGGGGGGGTASQYMQNTPMTPFDLEAVMRDSQLENMFDWLPMPDFPVKQETALPRASDPFTPSSFTPTSYNPFGYASQPAVDPGLITGDQRHSAATPAASTHKRRGSSPASTASDHAAKKARKPEKRITVDYAPKCLSCSAPMGRVILRAVKSEVPDPVAMMYRCARCKPVSGPPIQASDSLNSGAGPIIGTVDTRKRARAAVEAEDEDRPLEEKRAICDVCQRIVGSGAIVGGPAKDPLGHMAELVCASCDAKYQRCTDCGGGGGPRIGIGKWRLKQVFPTGRKTCGLTHNRLGDRPREIGVHVTPTDFTPEQLKEVLARCKALWNEKSMARLAVPEMFEIDLPPDIPNPLKDFSDVESIIRRQWPTREAMIRAEGADPARFKRILGLTWAHSRPRRVVRTVDLEEEAAKTAEGEDDDARDTVLAHVKRTNVVIPAGCDLIGMWGGEWDMQQGSLLISTFIPFEGADGEDSTALSVGEIITKVTALQRSINAERVEMQKQGLKVDFLRQCEHLWVVSGGAMPLVRERLADILIRKRSFVHVEEYLTRHPEFIEAIRARPLGLHPDLHRPLHQHVGGDDADPDYKPAPLVLARWLGRDHDAEQIQEIKQKEFGGKSIRKKTTKGKGDK